MGKNDKVIDVGLTFKDKIKDKLKDGKDWVVRNKEILIIVVPVAIGGLTTITKVVGKNINLHKEEAVKDLYCYDRSLGHYWKLKRKLSNREWVEIDQRKSSGERMSDILEQMRVLK